MELELECETSRACTGAVWSMSGASIHASQSLRSRPANLLLLGGFSMQFLQTIMLHFLHGATKSRAHFDTFPDKPRAEWLSPV